MCEEGLDHKSRGWGTPRTGKDDRPATPQTDVRGDVLPRLCRRRQGSRRNENDDEATDGFDQAALRAQDEHRADRAGAHRGDEREADVAGLNRQTFAGLGQRENADLREKRETEEARPAPAVRQLAHDAGDEAGPVRRLRGGERNGRQRGQRAESEDGQRDVASRENQLRIRPPTECGKFRDEMDADAAEDRECGEQQSGSGFHYAEGIDAG